MSDKYIDIEKTIKDDKKESDKKAKKAMEILAQTNIDNLCGHGVNYNDECKKCDELMASISVKAKLKIIYDKLVALEFVVQPENRRYCLELRRDISDLGWNLERDNQHGK